jgi:acyl-CoA thioesterase
MVSPQAGHVVTLPVRGIPASVREEDVTANLLGLEFDGSVASFTARPDLCTLANRAFGGAQVAAAILACERAIGRPAIMISCQFTAPTPVGARVSIEAEAVATGQFVTQARAHGCAQGRVVFEALLSLGGLEEPLPTYAPLCPALPPPDRCSVVPAVTAEEDATIWGHLEWRVGRGWIGLGARPRLDPAGPGRVAGWVRLRGIRRGDRASLAMLADWIPTAASDLFGMRSRGTSLDNSLRILRPPSGEWVLLDVQTDGFAHGIAHGSARLWNDQGDLLAVASQSFRPAPNP